MDLSAQTADTGYNQRYLLKETEMRQLLKRVTAMLLAVILAAGTGSIWYVPAASLKTRGGGGKMRLAESVWRRSGSMIQK